MPFPARLPWLSNASTTATRRVRSFGRPVVLAVGDTHTYRVDKPLRWPGTSVLISNFTRVEAFGNPHNHWVRVRVDPATREVFSFQQEIIPENVVRP